MLSPKTIQALDHFSEMVNLSKSVIVSLALSQYLEKKEIIDMYEKEENQFLFYKNEIIETCKTLIKEMKNDNKKRV